MTHTTRPSPDRQSPPLELALLGAATPEGTAVLRRLVSRGHRVRALSPHPSSAPLQGVSFLTGAESTPTALRELLKAPPGLQVVSVMSPALQRAHGSRVLQEVHQLMRDQGHRRLVWMMSISRGQALRRLVDASLRATRDRHPRRVQPSSPSRAHPPVSAPGTAGLESLAEGLAGLDWTMLQVSSLDRAPGSSSVSLSAASSMRRSTVSALTIADVISNLLRARSSGAWLHAAPTVRDR